MKLYKKYEKTKEEQIKKNGFESWKNLLKIWDLQVLMLR